MQEKIQSPCIRNCCLDPDNICLGCYRHIDEIVGWQNKTEQTKQQIIDLCQQRKHRYATNLDPEK